ncbi:MAG: hypothetical protein ACRDUY_12660 [Nitriliruptorales bacterium]
MNDLERLLRESLEARSGDVAATPALWNEVQRRAGRRRLRGWLAALSLAAAAVVVVGLAVPALLDLRRPEEAPQIFDEPSETPTATEPDDDPVVGGTEPDDAPSPTVSPTPVAAYPAGAPEWAVATDGFDVFLLREGRRGALLVEGPAEGFRENAEARYVAVAVRPGSTPEDVTGVLLEEGEGMYTLRWFRWTSGLPVEDQEIPAPYHVQDTRTDGAVPNPVWSPDGDFLAWLEGGDGGPFVIRAIQWTDGPGSADEGNDDASWEVEVDLSFGARLQEWTWVADDGETASGQLVITDPLSGGDSGTSLVVYPLERQADGALGVDPNAPYLQPDRDGAYLDVANGHQGLSEQDVRFFLTVQGAGEGTVDLSLTAVQASDEGEPLATPDEVRQTSDPTRIWMTAGGDAVLLGSGGRTWISARDGSLVRLGTTVWHADFLP